MPLQPLSSAALQPNEMTPSGENETHSVEGNRNIRMSCSSNMAVTKGTHAIKGRVVMIANQYANPCLLVLSPILEKENWLVILDT